MPTGFEGLNVGSLGIEATLDVSSVEAGLDRVSQGLDEARNAAQSAFADMNRLGQTVQGIVGPLTKLGGVISSSFLGLATMAPQVAPFLEKMKTDFFRLSNIAGEELAPAFRDVSNIFSDFVDFMGGEGRPILEGISSVIQGLTDGFQDLGDAIGSISETISISVGMELQGFLRTVADEIGPEAAAALIGFSRGGPQGAVAGVTAVQGLELGGNIAGAENPAQALANLFNTENNFLSEAASLAAPGMSTLTQTAANVWVALNQAPREKQRRERMDQANRK